MVVILIIAVLVAIAVPVYLGLEARADKTVAEYNIKAAEEIHTHIWYSIIEDNFFPAGGECYVDGANPVNALYVSTRETKIPWVDMNGAGSLAKEDSSGMLASLSPNPVLAQVSGGFQFSINGYYKNGALIENEEEVPTCLNCRVRWRSSTTPITSAASGTRTPITST
jgi:hypothetical protein